MAANLTSSEIDALLRRYFWSNRPYKAILRRLDLVHGFNRSLTWLKTQFQRLGLKRRSNTPAAVTSDMLIARNCIMRELRSSNRRLGYRAMWSLLKQKYGLSVKRKFVMEVLRNVDPEGVATRRQRRLQRRKYFNKGPNYCWHMDGYDKLSHYGFCIHGCIDGFSRRIMWLHVASSNSNPRVILYFFLEAIQNINGCPRVIRADKGTENVRVAAVQYALRREHDDRLAAERSIRYGSSPANTRIESWWSQLKKHKTGWWIHAFKAMEQQSLFDKNNEIHQKCLLIVFSPVIKRELNEFVTFWNEHRIRPSSGDCVGGIPNDLYQMPQDYGTCNFAKPLDKEIFEAAQTQASKPSCGYSGDLYSLCYDLVKAQYNLDLFKDISVDNALDIYCFLVESLSRIFA